MILVTDNGTEFSFWNADLARCIRCTVRTTGKLREQGHREVESVCRTCAPILAEVKARKEMVR